MSVRPPAAGGAMTDRRYTTRFAALLFLVFALGGGALLLAFFIVLKQPLPGTYAGIYFALRNLSAFLVPMLVFSMTAYVLLVIVAIAVICGYTFHKIAGPLYRMERALENYESGESIRAVFLREGDQLVALADAYNGFVARLREDRKMSLTAMEHAERLCLVDAATCKAEMTGALSRVSTFLSRYG